MNLVTIWHNPECSKSRAAMEILEQNSCEKEVVKYLQTPPNKEQIQTALSLLNISARELMRTDEDIYKELNLAQEIKEDKLVDAMVNHPKLIQRPVIFKDNKAIIGRPTSIIEDFIG